MHLIVIVKNINKALFKKSNIKFKNLDYEYKIYENIIKIFFYLLF